VSAPTRDPQHLSIGEVLSSLHDEFPDVTVSKIRFLESQGLIDPERTPSGYRRFYAADVERLRWILVQQRDHFLPLRVIKQRLDRYGPQGAPPLTTNGDQPAATATTRHAPTSPTRATSRPAPRAAPGPARRSSSSALTLPLDELEEPEETDLVAVPVTPPDAGAGHTREELCRESGLAAGALEELESYGLVAPTGGVGDDARYDDDAVEISRVAAVFYRHAVRARHLRMYQHIAEREAELFIQALILYRRQRNPAARARLEADLVQLGQAGARLRALMLRRVLRDAWPE